MLRKRGAVIRREGAREVAVLWEERDETGTHRIEIDVDEVVERAQKGEWDVRALNQDLDEWERRMGQLKPGRKRIYLEA